MTGGSPVTAGRATPPRELSSDERRAAMGTVTDRGGAFTAVGITVWRIEGGHLDTGPVVVHYEDPQGAGVPPSVLDFLSGYPVGSLEFRRVTGPTQHGSVAGAVYGWGGSASDAPGRRRLDRF